MKINYKGCSIFWNENLIIFKIVLVIVKGNSIKIRCFFFYILEKFSVLEYVINI